MSSDAMTLGQILEKFRSFGFLCDLHSCDGVTKPRMAKPVTTPGNCTSSRAGWRESLKSEPIEIEAAGLDVTVIGERVRCRFGGLVVPGNREPYLRTLETMEELYEELLHFWFDPDSPMSSEEGFVAASGRPVGAPPRRIPTSDR